MYKSEYIAELQLICSSSGSYVAKIRRGKINDVLNLLRSKAKITYNLDNRLIRMSYENYTLTYICLLYTSDAADE